MAYTIADTAAAQMAQRARKRSYTPVPFKKFIPDYLGTTEPDVSDPMQRALYASFKSRLAEVKGKVNARES